MIRICYRCNLRFSSKELADLHDNYALVVCFVQVRIVMMVSFGVTLN